MNLRKPAKFVAAMLALCFVAGCATELKIDWSSRVGHYTYDQALAEFGRPEASKRSADGGTVAEWLIQRGHAARLPDSRFARPGGFAGPLMPTMGEPYAPNYYMRLVFGPDGRLKDHREFAR